MKTYLAYGLTAWALAATAAAQDPVTLDGFITDGSGAGWPLYAKVVATPTQGGDEKRQHSRPWSGRYQMVTVAPSTEYTLSVSSKVPGYVPQTRTITTGSGDQQEDFALLVDTLACTAPGYAIVSGVCQFGGGGLFYGNVYDAMTGTALNAARVSISTGDFRYTVATPEDPRLDGGFYYLVTPIPAPDADKPVLTAAKPGSHVIYKERWPALNDAKIVNFRLPPPGLTERVNVASDGSEAFNPNHNVSRSSPALSADGRFVAFVSWAPNLVPDDRNGRRDAFVRDRLTGETSRVSKGNGGTFFNPAISADGRFVAFSSLASNLVPDDSNGRFDIFVHDRQTSETSRVSIASDGEQGNGHSTAPAASADGRFIAFTSAASNLVPGDSNNREDTFVHDRHTGQTSRVSVRSNGNQANNWSLNPAMSADGRFVTFRSPASNLVPGDSNGRWDIFVHDRQAGETSRVSVASDGSEANGDSEGPAMNTDGRFVAFESGASNLVSGDSNDRTDIFVHDRQTGETSRVSVASNGRQGNLGSNGRPALSADGRFVAYASFANNLVPGDVNGAADIFLHDRQTGKTSRVSVTSEGNEVRLSSGRPFWGSDISVSADGQTIAFTSLADDLVPNDTNHELDVFVHTLPPEPAAPETTSDE